MPAPRSERRRRRRRGEEADAGDDEHPLLRKDLLWALLLGGGTIIVILFIVLVSGGADDEAQSRERDQPPAPGDELPAEDLAAIEALARQSIEALPQGEWPALYDEFTQEFRDRCPREEFELLGAQAAQELGGQLPLLRFVRMERPQVEAEGSITAVIVGQLEGQPEYSLEGAFVLVDGSWRLAPVPATTGCDSFNRLEG